MSKENVWKSYLWKWNITYSTITPLFIPKINECWDERYNVLFGAWLKNTQIIYLIEDIKDPKFWILLLISVSLK